MKKRNWVLLILLAALAAGTFYFDIWAPANMTKQQQTDSTPPTAQQMVQRVQKAYSALGRASEVLKRRGEEAGAKPAGNAAQ